MDKDIRECGLPPICDMGSGSIDMMKELREEQNVSVDQEHLDIFYSLNKEQREGFDEIIEHVFSNKGQVFFVDGPGGTGKTFLYKVLLARVWSKGLIDIATATSGIAASILPGGHTAHSRFKIPIKIGDNNMCSFTKQSGIAELLRRASLIIWDEISMTKR
jgi:ATP-dependent DNA helicase PIF1